MSDRGEQKIQPLAPFVKIGADGEPFLEGFKCGACRETIAEGFRRACPSCGMVGSLESIRLVERGTLYSYTVVHRSFPGVTTPFIAALVDLEDGGAIRGILTGVDPDFVQFDMPVRIVFDMMEIGGDPSVSHVRHIFVPERDLRAASNGE